jgi:antitoxin component YwqK of YwqJK toxin-antitoxin module
MRTIKNLTIIVSLLITAQTLAGNTFPFSGLIESETEISVYTSHYATGELKVKYSEQTGDYVTYYINGQIEEKGQWKQSHNTGELTRYYKNGKTWQSQQLNGQGLKDGSQIYYFANGEMAMMGSWLNGKISGTLIRYNDNGTVKSKNNYVGGKLTQTEPLANRTSGKQ